MKIDEFTLIAFIGTLGLLLYLVSINVHADGYIYTQPDSNGTVIISNTQTDYYTNGTQVIEPAQNDNGTQTQLPVNTTTTE